MKKSNLKIVGKSFKPNRKKKDKIKIFGYPLEDWFYVGLAGLFIYLFISMFFTFGVQIY